jgi:hypothetical protein
MSKGFSLLLMLAASFTVVSPALAQSPSFVTSYTLSNGNTRTLQDGATITFPSVDVNAVTTATIDIANQGTGPGSVTGISVTGTGFLLSNSTFLPATVGPNQVLRFGIVFAPAQIGSFTGTFRIELQGGAVSGKLAASTPPPVLSLSYIDPDTTSVLPLPNDTLLQFPNTLVGSNSVITLLVANSGTGTGSVSSISLGSGTSGFQLLSLPPLPVSVPPAQQLRFGIRFTPQQKQTATDTLRLAFSGQTISINLQAVGIQPQYTYQWSSGAGDTPILPAGTLPIADTVVGQTSNIVISVSNTGTADGVIPNVAVTGQGLSLSNLPVLPFTLRPKGSQQFTLSFAPTQPGSISGRLTIGSDTFTITSSGIGSRLIFTYSSGSAAVPVADAGVVLFPPLAVGSTGTLNFSIQNTGTSAATISNVSLAAQSTVFALPGLPALPVNLAPGATISFPISFVPNTTGSLTTTLRVNTNSFTLSGSGTQPAALPAYTFQGPSGNQQPAQQPSIGLSLASPYPAALQGTLKLGFVSAVFTDDSAIQFATGGRTVSFTIPANSTQALFASNATTVPLQTGTTAGNIVITPSFSMQVGFDVTPASPNVLTLTIPRSAPLLTNASISAQTLTSFTVALSGYSTTRALRQLDIVVTPKPGQNFSSTHLTIDVSSSSAAWFQSATSQGFGGSFLVAIPFVLSNGSTTTDLVRLLQSLSITATNETGVSNAISVAIP